MKIWKAVRFSLVALLQGCNHVIHDIQCLNWLTEPSIIMVTTTPPHINVRWHIIVYQFYFLGFFSLFSQIVYLQVFFWICTLVLEGRKCIHGWSGTLLLLAWESLSDVVVSLYCQYLAIVPVTPTYAFVLAAISSPIQKIKIQEQAELIFSTNSVTYIISFPCYW